MDCPAVGGVRGEHPLPAGAVVIAVVLVAGAVVNVVDDNGAAFFALEHEVPMTNANAASAITAESRTRTARSVPGSEAHAHAGCRHRGRAGPAPRTDSVR